ncbi:MAG: hypothetical protein NEA02_00650 [Thermoanaerobaculia bacterium]|nr:hypothetical protein [Thermoanaerobaculia bacterium]
MRKTRSLAWLAISGFIVAAPPAPAEDFEFEVPVQLSKIDPVFTQGKVSCQVLGIDRDGAARSSSKDLTSIAGASTTFALVQGGFSGTVSVKFDAERPRRQPTDARTWSCVLFLVAPSGSEALCLSDPATGRSKTRQLPALLNLDPASVKGCTGGTLPVPK